MLMLSVCHHLPSTWASRPVFDGPPRPLPAGPQFVSRANDGVDEAESSGGCGTAARFGTDCRSVRSAYSARRVAMVLGIYLIGKQLPPKLNRTPEHSEIWWISFGPTISIYVPNASVAYCELFSQ